MRGKLATLLFALALALAPCAPAMATVDTTVSSSLVLGNGVQTVFSFNFIGVAAKYINVIYTNPSGVQTVLSRGPASTQYQVSINVPLQGAIWGVGGTVTYNPSGTPIPNGSSLTITRTLPLTQDISLQNQASYGQYAKSAESAVDLTVLQGQQTAALLGRAIVANAANSAAPLPLPPASTSAGLGVCFDGTGNNLIACSSVPSGTISTAMAPVVSAATLALGRTAFGLGALATEGFGAGLQDNGASGARVYWPVTTDATSQAVTSAFHHTQRYASSGITYTLPASSTLFNGFIFIVYNGGSTSTITPDGADAILGQSSGASYTVGAGAVAVLTTNAAGTWLMGIQGSATSAGNPIHYAGEDITMRTNNCPAGSLLENGAAVSRTTYAALFAAMGTTWGVGDGSTTFNLPDTGGQFDRGWYSGQTVDSARTFGGTSPQLDAFQAHTHALQTVNFTALGTAGAKAGAGGGGQTGAATGRTSTETRPTNITIYHCLWTGINP